ncbi:hypothetical protein B0H11DRAFT_1914761 [Mycena galericulata]|nr:hypothetical protein B0H11DRAFT_1914761 [Mycena galericulata]
MSGYRTPSDSSHASRVLAAALRTPIPRAPPTPLPPACITNPIADGLDGNVSDSRSVPVYHLYGLDYGSDTTSDTGSARLSGSMVNESQYERVFPLKLPLKTLWRPPLQEGNRSSAITSDVFGPVVLRRKNQDIVYRQLTAGRAAHVQRLRTIHWVRKIRRNAAKGALIQDVHVL